MMDEKLILIVCDDTARTSGILQGIGKNTFPLYSTVTVASATGFITLAKSLEPHLIILCFRNNLLLLNDFAVYVKKKGIPILCFLQPQEQELHYLQAADIVFTYPMEQLSNRAYLLAKVNAILQLRTPTAPTVVPGNLAAAAMQYNQEHHGRTLSRYVLELDQKVEVLSKIKDRILGLYPKANDPVKTELLSIVNTIKQSVNRSDLWEDFKKCFEETNPHFLLALVKKYPYLTPVDIKYCCYVRMNMTNDDIKNLFCISLESVRTHKYRLKKKMSLPKEEDLRSYLQSVG